MAFLYLNFDNFEFRDLGHSDFLSFKVLAPTLRKTVTREFSCYYKFFLVIFNLKNLIIYHKF